MLLGGFYTPGGGVVDSLRAATMVRERAREAGATIEDNCEVLGD
jgi:glycine/D-amino acid oxidase-like deaminating enzyme